MKFILEDKKKYVDLDHAFIKKANLPVICLSGVQSENPQDFDYVVFDQNDKIRAKFIELEYAKEYAEFLSDNVG